MTRVGKWRAVGNSAQTPSSCGCASRKAISIARADSSSAALEQGADYVSIGKSALANPDWPMRIRDAVELRVFDKNLLAPSADVKNCELV
ncbi:hypothetical protein [Pantoea sp. SOD02]|uniref:hypothetical protein n=1 Tax=Pantoea sp. SOD02 TaxID=2970818 RepID=UPI0021587A01|nr:hypothetical protein [Pantoea sp. SOD02]UVC31100.1 hypothetical protein NR302_09215 [Pantoea sp. SOD02]